MLDETKATALFVDYYAQWVQVYKEGAIREVTLAKYKMTQAWLKKLVPELQLCNMTRITYQQLINNYAQHHERQTTMDFHHQLKGAILDAVDEGLIDRKNTGREENQISESVRTAHALKESGSWKGSELGLVYPACSKNRHAFF